MKLCKVALLVATVAELFAAMFLDHSWESIMGCALTALVNLGLLANIQISEIAEKLEARK
jgi:hypothetical protein